MEGRRGVRLTVLGGDGGWPRAGSACSGYLVEAGGYALLVDPGYATASRLFTVLDPRELDAVLVSHGHPDHCIDLSAVLRARAFGDRAVPALPVYAPAGALDAVLALDRPGVLDAAVAVTDLDDGARLQLGPLDVEAVLLPHTWPNLGYRVSAAGQSLAYTGDTGPSDRVVDLARHATLLLAEASHAEQVPADMAGLLSSARDAGAAAARAEVGRLLLTHLLPDTDPLAAIRCARESFPGEIDVARPGLVLDLGEDVRPGQ
jgi:ribonuclease BN (tRNA processing enzyme)